MTVYTDGVHMISDQAPDAAELHVLAGQIGLQRRWFQGNHYDLTTRAKAVRAVVAGAVLVDMRDIGRIMIRRRAGLEAAAGFDPTWAPSPLDPAGAADANTKLMKMFAPGRRVGLRGGDHL